MTDYGRRLIVQLAFETTVGEVSRAIRAEGLEMIGRTDVRELFRQECQGNFRHYMLLEVWSPELAFRALRENPDIGPMLPAAFAVYELSPTETVVVVSELRPKHLKTTYFVDEAIRRIGQVLHRLEHSVPCHLVPAA